MRSLVLRFLWRMLAAFLMGAIGEVLRRSQETPAQEVPAGRQGAYIAQEMPAARPAAGWPPEPSKIVDSTAVEARR